MQKNNYKEFIKLNLQNERQDSLNILIISLISKEHTGTQADCNRSIEELTKIRTAMEELHAESVMQEAMQNRYINLIDEGMDICRRELSSFASCATC